MSFLAATRNWTVGLALACVLGVVPSAVALDPARRLSDYARDTWKMPDGLPHNSITAIVQTRDGYLWLGTLDGLARFDGVRYETFNLIREAGLESNVVTAVVEDREGVLWIGTTSGLVRVRDGRFTAFTKKDGLADASIRTLLVGRDGSLWIGTRWGGLNHLVNGRFSAIGASEGLWDNDVLGVAEDGGGTLWVATMEGLNRVRDGRVSSVVFEGRSLRTLVASVLADSSKRIWIGTADGIWRLASDQRTGDAPPTARRHSLPRVPVRAFYEDQEGNIWVGLGSGLARVQNDSVEVAEAGMLSYPNVRSMAADREGSLWLGTDGGGLNRLRDASVVTLPNPAADPQASVMVIHRDPSGTMWTGANCGGISRWGTERITTFTIKDGLPNDCIRALASGADGSLWVGSLWGVAVLNHGTIKTYSTAEGLSSNRIMALAIDRQGTAWIGTSVSGVDRLAGGRFTNYSTQNGLVHNDVRSILEARDGTVWIGTLGGGVSLWRNGRFESLTRQQGLSNNNVLALLEDADGTMWIGTNGGGLNRFRNGTLKHYTTDNGLFSDGIFQILDDGGGSLWMGCNRGIFRVSRQDLDDVAAGRRKALRSEWFGHAEGLKSAGTMGGSQPAGAVATDGRLWFPTIDGVAIVDPRRLVRNPVPPPVHIEKIMVDGRVVSSEELAGIAPGNRAIDIEYSGLTFVAPGKAMFRYRLVGFNDEWQDVGSRRTAYFAGLNPGRYRFEVLATNNDGVTSSASASVEFELLPRFYQTWLFYGGCGVLALGLVWTGFRVRERQLLDRERRLKQQVEQALTEIKVLSGLLPICASCKRIRDDHESWRPLESYIHEHSQASFSHGICPDCMTKLYPDYEP